MKSQLLKFIFLLVIFSGLLQDGFSQNFDTLKLMTYNLLYYRQTTSFCTNSNNNTVTKENAMEDIIDYVLPDILVVNEMGGGNSVNAFRLLQNSLNQNGRSFYTQANSSGLGQSLVNMLYFNSNKLVLESQTLVDKDLNNNNLVRVIDIYTLRYNDPNLAIHNDTVRIHVIAAHLKAGNSGADALERDRATEAVMAHLDTINATGNYFFAGDLNLYTGSEQAYRNMLLYPQQSLRFFDPVNISQNWSNDSRFAILHTQSTRTSGGCFAGGGMDDRFDFILMSDEVSNNTDRLEYIANSYEALGQDGNRFNGSIISPTNNSVPTTVSQALFNMSDHLPVTMEVKLTIPNLVGIQEVKSKNPLKFQNPTNGRLSITIDKTAKNLELIQLFDVTGKLKKELFVNGVNQLELNISHFENGIYFLKSIDKNGFQTTQRLIKL
jgi:endonuclease/exonuclease/phosphatase family metal-dependent hydrolase